MQGPKADIYDKFIDVDVVLPNSGDTKLMAKVVKKVKSDDQNKPDTYNPLKDNSIYEVPFMDGTTEAISANVIAESMITDCDAEGYQYSLFNEISDHWKDGDTLNVADGFHVSKHGNKTPKRTTKGWKLLIEWKDGSMDWLRLSEVKEAYPLQLAEYAVANNIANEPVFNWWVVHDTLRKRNRIINKVKSRYWRTTHKFGIQIPKSVQEACEIDRTTGTSHWTRAIDKEMQNVRIAFERLGNITEDQMRGGKIKPGYTYCSTHTVFDIKMDGIFTRKARLVPDGHKTKPPASITYSSVVSRDSVRIALTLASLNGLEVSSCDIGNAYLNADCREKLWTLAGPEFGSERGSVMIIARALYVSYSCYIHTVYWWCVS